MDHSLTNIKAVLFDAGNTLLKAEPAVEIRYASTAAKYGVHADPTEIRTRFVRLWKSFEEQRKKAMFQTTREGTREFWRSFVMAVFEPWIDDFTYISEFFDELYRAFADHHAWVLYEDALPTLEGLKDRDITLGIVSNWDHRLYGILKGTGIDEYFDVTLVSAEEGIEKPATEIFQTALTALNVEPSQTVHIGDSMTDDVCGALASGIHAVYLNRGDSLVSKAYTQCNRAEDEGYWSISTLTALLGLIK